MKRIGRKEEEMSKKEGIFPFFGEEGKFFCCFMTEEGR